ncbi:hypothetical protein [Rhizobium leguminosarum]|uniref:hypothetical protein n=1 Tax=Rhizobium leguminosarum TaxID=384 RepID=UPI003F9E28ED
MAESDRKDIILKWAELVTGQSTDLWTVALAFLIAQILIIATLQSSSSKANGRLMSLMLFSGACSLFSLFFGYFTKGAVIGGLEIILKPGSALNLPAYPAFDALIQAILLLLSLVTFIAAFGFYRSNVSRALLGLFGK